MQFDWFFRVAVLLFFVSTNQSINQSIILCSLYQWECYVFYCRNCFAYYTWLMLLTSIVLAWRTNWENVRYKNIGITKWTRKKIIDFNEKPYMPGEIFLKLAIVLWTWFFLKAKKSEWLEARSHREPVVWTMENLGTFAPANSTTFVQRYSTLSTIGLLMDLQLKPPQYYSALKLQTHDLISVLYYIFFSNACATLYGAPEIWCSVRCIGFKIKFQNLA